MTDSILSSQKKTMLRTSTLFTLLLSLQCFGQWTSNQTPTYYEAIESYRKLADDHRKIMRYAESGSTDAGHPLSILIIDGKGQFNPALIQKEGRTVCMIMNAIHAGEACGVNASLEFAKAKAKDPGNVVYVIIPIYNVGGALQRNSSSRANQNGPEEYGFRGNARNLDLNRDFIKCDSKNAQSFSQIYHLWKPQIFIDTHTSNGADYQHTMTLLHTFPEKLNNLQASLLKRDLLPFLYNEMEKKGEPMAPYVSTIGGTPETGIQAFTDLPRYSTGYVGLFNTIGFMTETHMLKTFEKRVKATLQFLLVMDTLLEEKGQMLVQLKQSADREAQTTKTITCRWKLAGEAETVKFSGYRADSIKSQVTGLMRLRYDKNKPYTEEIPYYNKHEGIGETKLPTAYIIPKAWHEVVQLFSLNGINYQELTSDTIMKVVSTYVTKFETSQNPFEGHYMHYSTETVERIQDIRFYKGDIIIRTNQTGNTYLAHVLDPRNDDSFFNWNFFDAVLSQKEYFSDYVFEDLAEEILNSNSSLKRSFEEKKRTDKTFASSSRAQLDFIYKNSVHYEQTQNRIPIYKQID